MLFTRRFEISRMQVLVMDPNLIPHAVNVVIGENLYELKFQVEGASDAGKPQPMDMDQFHCDRGHEAREEGKGDQYPHKPVTGGKADGGNSFGNLMGKRTSHGAGQKLATFHIKMPVVLGVGASSMFTQGSSVLGDDVGSVLGVDVGSVQNNAGDFVQCNVVDPQGSAVQEVVLLIRWWMMCFPRTIL
jgi:hypothetical protein